MSKSSASEGEWDETVHYELSCGGYVAEDCEVALTNYLLHLPSQNYVTVEIDVYE